MGLNIVKYYSNLLDENGYLVYWNANSYMYDMIFAQNFAEMNRHVMAEVILQMTGDKFIDYEYIESFHNYIDIETNLVRKGAISANKDENCIVSLNMREGILLCIGIGNPKFNYSCAHGLGRKKSRGDVEKTTNDLLAFKNMMDGVISLDINKETLDESPMAYKDSLQIMELIQDTVIINKTLKAIMNVKG